ncbi:hypothetical protein HDU98_003517 [Podochytrium sp. JEL0797]|nr:hypothetical protein HDU98_003517 [Podochytrium sp. JEL0797]
MQPSAPNKTRGARRGAKSSSESALPPAAEPRASPEPPAQQLSRHASRNPIETESRQDTHHVPDDVKSAMRRYPRQTTHDWDCLTVHWLDLICKGSGGFETMEEFMAEFAVLPDADATYFARRDRMIAALRQLLTKANIASAVWSPLVFVLTHIDGKLKYTDANSHSKVIPDRDKLLDYVVIVSFHDHVVSTVQRWALERHWAVSLCGVMYTLDAQRRPVGFEVGLVYRVQRGVRTREGKNKPENIGRTIVDSSAFPAHDGPRAMDVTLPATLASHLLPLAPPSTAASGSTDAPSTSVSESTDRLTLSLVSLKLEDSNIALASTVSILEARVQALTKQLESKTALVEAAEREVAHFRDRYRWVDVNGAKYLVSRYRCVARETDVWIRVGYEITKPGVKVSTKSALEIDPSETYEFVMFPPQSDFWIGAKFPNESKAKYLCSWLGVGVVPPL